MPAMGSHTDLGDTELAVWRAYSSAARLLFARLDRELQRDARLPRSYLDLLGVLADGPARAMRMSDLAEVTMSAPSRLTHAVSQLEAAGWVRRERCNDDRRGCYARITDEGMDVLRTARAAGCAGLRTHFFEHLSPEQLQQLREVSETLLAHLTASAEPACEPAEAGSPQGG
jgi:DNA-binding MarR family transcriptional regulator